MPTEFILAAALLLATSLCTLVAGFLLSFAIVVMPGIGALSDREFLRAFQVIDNVIQDKQPLFVSIWIGSVAMLVAATVLGIWQFEGVGRILVAVAAATYLPGVQLPTFTVNIPLNNRVQSLSLDALDEATLAAERQLFETSWNRWNVVRTVSACLTSTVLLLVVWLT